MGDLKDLIDRGNAGDQAANEILKAFLAQGGNEASRAMGNVALLAEKALLSTVLSSHPAVSMAVGERLRTLAPSCAGGRVSLKKLAIDRVILAYSFACVMDMLVAYASQNGPASERCLKTQLLGEKRVQEAMKSLEIAREISRPRAAVPWKVVAAPAERRSAG